MSDEPTPYEKNTKEQYEALGRFVEAFEAMVDEARSSCIQLLASDTQHAKWVAVPLYHQSMTAKPLFEIFRCIIMQMMNDVDFRKIHNVSDALRDSFYGTLAPLAGEFNRLSEIRNDLLHGTWFIGDRYGSNEDATEFEVKRHKINKHGISASKPLPKTATELNDLTNRCKEVEWWVAVLFGCMPNTKDILKFDKCFSCTNGVWRRLWPSEGTLPEASE